jgi:hypothetical protein
MPPRLKLTRLSQRVSKPNDKRATFPMPLWLYVLAGPAERQAENGETPLSWTFGALIDEATLASVPSGNYILAAGDSAARAVVLEHLGAIMCDLRSDGIGRVRAFFLRVCGQVAARAPPQW